MSVQLIVWVTILFVLQAVLLTEGAQQGGEDLSAGCDGLRNNNRDEILRHGVRNGDKEAVNFSLTRLVGKLRPLMIAATILMMVIGTSATIPEWAQELGG